MAENRISIEGIAPINGTIPTTNQGNTASTPLFVTDGFPTGINFYTTQIADVPGVVAANNFISIFNPVGSGKVLKFYQFILLPWATAATSATTSLLVTKTSAASGGVLLAAASVSKFLSTTANSIAEVRTANPTVTKTGIAIVGIPPAITSAAQGISTTATLSPPTGASVACLPGEGVVVSTALGTVSQLWNMGFVWSES